MRIYISLIIFSASLFYPLSASSDDHHHQSSPHQHELYINNPLGVFGGNRHNKGHWMLGYSFMYHRMDGNRTGFVDTSIGNLLKKYYFASESMNMYMHMFSLMYTPHPAITIMSMVNLTHSNMSHYARNISEISYHGAYGLGDLILAVDFNLPIDLTRHQFFIHLKLGIPTGSIDVYEPREDHQHKLPYNMQLGSGTFDIGPGFTYKWHNDYIAVGVQYSSWMRLFYNNFGYRKGNNYHISTWISGKIFSWFGMSLKLKMDIFSKIKGQDFTIIRQDMPGNDPANSGGQLMNLFYGCNWQFERGKLKGIGFAFEVGGPIFIHYEGVQMKSGVKSSAKLYWAIH